MGKKPAFQTLAYKNRKEEITHECFLTTNNLKISDTYKCEFILKKINTLISETLFAATICKFNFLSRQYLQI